MNDNSVVTLHPLHFGVGESYEREVGRVETGVFVTLPAEGVALLEWLSGGLTLGQVHACFTERFGTEPDLADFLQAIDECGFVAAVDGEPSAVPASPVETSRGVTLLGGLRQEQVAWLLALPMRLLYRAIWIAVPVLVLIEPRLLLRPSDTLLFDQVLASTIALAVVGWTLVFLHECAHAITARALGCTGRLSLSRRLYFVVAQTDISGVRAAPRKRRYAAFLAGMTWDAAIMLGCLLAQLAGVGGFGERLARMVVYALALGLAFQCLVFMRTDLYYVLANWLRLGNLMDDTRHVLVNHAHQLLGRAPRHDLSLVPPRELRIVRWYAPFYVLGSTAAMAGFGVLSVPALAQLVGTAVRGVDDGPRSASFWDGAGFMLLVTAQFVALFWVWVVERRDRAASMASYQPTHGGSG